MSVHTTMLVIGPILSLALVVFAAPLAAPAHVSLGSPPNSFA